MSLRTLANAASLVDLSASSSRSASSSDELSPLQSLSDSPAAFFRYVHRVYIHLYDKEAGYGGGGGGRWEIKVKQQ